ncbi:hypothetical protein B0H19DRAFT_1075722 [Mycena capillaripes]|nr:hypothetical protein B0H19DRAFT_1075722 [Mycena capillaripes]
MHAALGIPDLVDLVISELDPLSEAKELAALACCSIFHETALDALWRHQDNGINNLLRCMPRDLWVTSKRRRKSKPYRVVVASDFDRVYKYAHRIRSLACPYEELYTLDFHLLPVYEVLGQHFSGDYLLPNLEWLDWQHWGSAYSPFIQLFLGPRVTSITLGEKSDGPYHALAMVRQMCPGLTSLVVEAVEEESDESQRRELSLLVQGLTHVESLALRTIDFEALRYLGYLPTLKNLNFKFHDSATFSGVPDSSMFCSLCEVTCHHVTIALLLAFLRTWNNPHLNSFHVSIHDCRGFDEIEQLYQLLASHCAHDHLTKLDVDILCHKIVLHPGHIFRHLFCFSHLTLVEITVRDGYNIDNAIISDMACAWPHIEQLSLISMGSRGCTLLALVSFARHCPRLWGVSIPLDFSSIPPPVNGVVQETLWHLGWDLNTPVDAGTSKSVAEFLASIFPNLTDVGEHHGHWVEVENLIPEITKGQESQ